MQRDIKRVPVSRRQFLSRSVGVLGAGAVGSRHGGGSGHGDSLFGADTVPMVRNERCRQVLDRLKGPMASITIPYNSNFSIDHGALRAWVDFMCEKKQPILFLTYGDSELGFLKEQEIEAVIRTVATQARGRSLVIGGTGAWWTERTIEFINRVEDSGVDAINVHMGSLTRNEDNLYAAYRDINDRTKLPLLTSSAKYSLDLLVRIAQLPNFIGDKCHEELYKYHQYCRATSKYDYAVLSAGLMKHFLFGYFAGSTAYLCAAAPFAPEMTLKFYHALTQGNYDAARDIVLQFEDPLVDITSGLGYPHCYKSLLYLMGFYKTTLMRPPRISNHPEELGELKTFLQNHGLIAR